MRRLIPLLALSVLLVACSATASAPTFDLEEFSISGPDVLDEGIGTLEVVNSGDLPHTLVVTDPSGQVVAATSLIRPGETSTLDVDLEDGRYIFTCRIVAENDEGEIVDHFEAGMHSIVEVSG